MKVLVTATAALCLTATASLEPASGAENLRLREGISFMHDLDRGFPVIADKMDDVKIESQRPTLIFFGASGDLNTNRQARRLVEIYKKYRQTHLKFVIVDVDHADSPESKQLIKSYYQGYIPGEVILDKDGKTSWSHSGEADFQQMTRELDKVLAR